MIQVLIGLRLTAEGQLLKTVDEVGIRLKAPIHHARKSCTLNPVTKVQKKDHFGMFSLACWRILRLRNIEQRVEMRGEQTTHS
jgi:hypothetical protein